MKKKLRRYSRHVGRWTWYAAAAVLLLLAVGFTTARVLLPELAQRKDEIEAAINRVSPHPVRIEKLSTYWDGWHPGLQVQGLQVFAADRKTPALRLEELRISLAWWPLLRREFEIHSLEVSRPSLVLERLADGRFRLAGFDPVRPGDEGQGENFLHWLFRQNRLAIIDGEFEWRDRREPGKALRLSKVNLTLRNSGERHRLGVSAVFPPGLCRECSFILDVTGNPLVAPDWNGEIYLRAGDVNLDALPRIARERLPQRLQGRFDARLWTRWQAGRPRSLEGRVDVHDLQLPVTGLPAPLSVREASGDVEWKAVDGGWQLDLSRLALGLKRPVWAAEYLRIGYRADEQVIEAGHLDLADLTAFAESVRDEHELLRLWSEFRPAGAVNKFKLRVAGDWSAPSEFSLAARLDGFGVQPWRRYPGVQGVSGQLAATAAGGEFRADSKQVVLTLPEVFRGPLAARQVRGQVSWEKGTEHWEIVGDNLRLASEDGQASGDFRLRLPHDPARSPYLRLAADFRDLNGAHAARYYPPKYLTRETLAWMERSFVDGRVTKGKLLYDGPTREFPFTAGGGKFEIRGHVRDGVYGFLPGWQPVRQAEVDVEIDRDQVRVTGQGRIGNLAATDVVVQTQVANGREEVHVRAAINGPVNDALGVLYGIAPGADGAAWTRYLPAGLQASGNGALALTVAVPLDTAPVRVSGEYRFQQAGVREPGSGAVVDALEGQVRFDENGLRDSQLRGRFLGGDATLTAVQDGHQFVVHGQGRIAADGLHAVLGSRIAPQVSGAAGWNATWRSQRGSGALQAEIGLRGLKSRLPPPLHFPDGLPVEKLVLKTETATGDSHVLALSAGNRIGGRLVLQRRAGAWQFAGGRVGFGEERASPVRGRGLHLSAQIDALDLDPWFPLLGQEGGDTPSWLSRVSADIRTLDLFDRRFGRVAFDLAHDKGGWNGTVSGAAAVGRVRYARRGRDTQVDLDLATLNLPGRLGDRQDTDVDPRRLPAVTVKAKSFLLKDKPLGELDFAAQPLANGWRVARLNLARPETQLTVSGDWRLTGNSHQSEFDVRLNSSDMSKTLNALGIPEQMSGGEVSVVSHLAWPASPANLGLARLSGNAEITAERGRFLQLKQGAGRFFGVLDLSAIGRYLTLDFSPIFGQGFVFDRIHTKMTLERGNVYTDDLSIRGPSAKMNIHGRIGLAAEDFDLVMNVQPQLTDSLTLTSLGIWGPQVAAAALLLQKIFKKEITEGTRVSYVVKGPWDNPNVTRTIEEAATKAEPRPKG